ncbi:serine hydrolase [Saccharopolyspora sp. 6M]|uniref:serine hydrolase domain-containing protein n=1 Tax=Saccharopolyspora sp. 6M TaxID=2877237 RepID=UPI001CD4FCB4|nr:serine hydrolase domain-containing protein [Saccharopolyspora sp. 6M]MCA1226772.1 beta-lactamase family protein [Saccharopolyspora sp. 6M]
MSSIRTARRAALTAVVVTALVGTAAQAAPPDVQDVLNAYQAQTGPGAGVHGGDPAGSWELSAGTAQVGTARPLRSTDHFRAYSQTKTFTATTVLQLVDEGSVELDAPIERYLPGVVAGGGYDGGAITVRHLLQHTSGVPAGLPDPRPGPDGTYSLESLVRAGLSSPPVHEPGGEFVYANTNYLVLGMLIERITGEPVGTALTERIIRPLGLADTTYPAAGDRSVPEPRVNGYRGGRVPPFDLWFDVTTNSEPSRSATSGAIISTQRDLVRFYRALLDGELTSPAALAEMKRTVPIPEGGGNAAGLGLISRPLACGGAAWGHSGSGEGYLSLTEVTEDGGNASVLTNAQIDSPLLAEVTGSALCG